jgi:hypothetical protein
MGLAERRAAKEFQDKQFVSLQVEIQKLAGNPIPIEVDWDQLAVAEMAHNYAESWPELYFKPIIEALRMITRDQMGKDAIKAGLKKVEIRNSKGAYYPETAITFESGTLAIDHSLSNVGDTKARTDYIVQIVEKGL